LSALGGYNQDSTSGELLAAEVQVIRVEVEVESDLKALPESEEESESGETTGLGINPEQAETKPELAETDQPASGPGGTADLEETMTEPAAEDEPEIAASSSSEPAVNVAEEGLKILRETVGVAREFAQKYIALVRIQLDQFWLGPSESQLRVTWISRLLDSDGHDIRVGYSDPMPVRMHWSDSALSKELHTTLVRQASEGVEPSLADTFLRDGEYAAYRLTDPNLRQAVLLAAVACEIKIKDVITTLATSEQRPLVDLLLENPREWTMAAASLFDKGLKAVCGKSLREEDRNLYKKIDLLFQDRNKIAHRGGTGVSPDSTLKEHISSAKSAFEWLNGIQNQAGSEGEG